MKFDSNALTKGCPLTVRPRTGRQLTEAPPPGSFRVQRACFATPCPLRFPGHLFAFCSQVPDAALIAEGKGWLPVFSRCSNRSAAPLHPCRNDDRTDLRIDAAVSALRPCRSKAASPHFGLAIPEENVLMTLTDGRISLPLLYMTRYGGRLKTPDGLALRALFLSPSRSCRLLSEDLSDCCKQLSQLQTQYVVRSSVSFVGTFATSTRNVE